MSNNTYVALKTTTVTGSPAASVTLDLTGISGYTDIVIVSSVKLSSSSSNLYMQVGNGSVDTGTNYSNTLLAGDGSSASSYRNSNTNQYTIGEITATNFDTVITNVMNYANTTTYKTVLNRSSAASYKVDTWVGLWRSTSAINTIKLFNDTQTFAVGSTFTVYGIANADVGAYATGGIITQDANYYYHAFGSSSTFTPTRNLTADILVVAGGGGGGNGTGGGGGAGGVVATSSVSLVNGTGYTCTIGAGGAGSNNTTNGANGVNSNMTGGALSLTAALGGGGGASFNGAQAGSSGASGGGGAYGGAGGSATQGYAGGSAGSLGAASNFTGGGGGGAGGIGGNGTDATITGGIGGNGTSAYNSWLQTTGLGVLNSSDNLRYLAGGGGGSAGTSGNIGIGGKGGGGNSNIRGVGYASSAIPNTGSGGGGDGSASAVYAGNGGSGLIIVRYSK